MQITLELDEKLLSDVQSYTSLDEPSAAIKAAMTGFIQHKAAMALARMGGSQPHLKRILGGACLNDTGGYLSLDRPPSRK